MTLEEFRNVAHNEWGVDDLMRFCWDNDYDEVVEDIYSSDSYDEYIGSCVDDYASDHGWRELRDYIDEFPDPYENDYWINDGWGDFCPIERGDGYFEELIENLEERLIENDFFDDSDEDDEEDECITDDSAEDDGDEDLIVSVESVSIMYGWVV